MVERPKRQTLQLDITQAARQSLSIARLNDRLKGERTSIVKRALITDTLRAGAMVDEAGLSSVFAFLDTEKFNNATQQEKQLLILQALQLRLDLEPLPVKISSPGNSLVDDLPPASTDARIASDSEQSWENQEEPTAEVKEEKVNESGAVKAAAGRFSKKFGGA